MWRRRSFTRFPTSCARRDHARCVGCGRHDLGARLHHSRRAGAWLRHRHPAAAVRTRDTTHGYDDDWVFKENQTLVIQPNIVTLDEKAGVQTGDLCVITPEGRPLTS